MKEAGTTRRQIWTTAARMAWLLMTCATFIYIISGYHPSCFPRLPHYGLWWILWAPFAIFFSIAWPIFWICHASNFLISLIILGGVVYAVAEGIRGPIYSKRRP